MTEHLWRISQAWTSCLRQEVMRVIGVRVQEEMTGSQSGMANSRELLDNADRANHFQNSTFCGYIWTFQFHLIIRLFLFDGMIFPLSFPLTHTQTHKHYQAQITD